MQGEREKKGGRDGQRKKMSNTDTQDGERRKRDRSKQMSARSHQLGAGILKQNV